VRVLVAEDSASVRAMLCDVLAGLGHEPVAAEDGVRAWDLYRTVAPDAIISDRDMPGLDGLELCRRVRAAEGGPYTYFIFLTGLTERSEILAGMEHGADDYLAKPLDLDELQARLMVARRVTALHRRLAEQAEALARANADLARANASLRAAARTDPLTGLANRLALGEHVADLAARAERYGRRYALIVADVDRFKRYNDTLGHQAGDEALRAVARAVRAAGRDADRAYRLGGEELLVVLPARAPV
jgi:two-component system, cell cycle response regulator